MLTKEFYQSNNLMLDMNNRIRFYIIIAVLVFLVGCESSEHGLSEYEEIDSLTEFAPELSIEGNTFKGSFSDDLNTFYFFRKIAPNVEKYVPYESRFKDGNWMEPVIPEYYDEDYSYTYQLNVPNSEKLVFISDKRTDADTSARPNYNFWILNKVNNHTEELGVNNLIYHYNSQPSIVNDGTIYFTSDSPDWSKTESYKMSYESGAYTEPELFEPVNRWRENESWTIYEYTMSPEGDYMIVCIQEDEGAGPNVDLYISYLENESWSVPKKLGASINSPETENFPVITMDGKFLIFTRGFSQFYIMPTRYLSTN